MMSELVDGSAWIWPPVEGWFALFRGASAALEALPWPPPFRPTGEACCPCWGEPPPAAWDAFCWPAAIAARSVAASRTASAFFR